MIGLIILYQLKLMNYSRATPRFLSFCLFIAFGLCRCRYNVNDQYIPYQVDTQPFQLGTLSACKDYIAPDRLGCCNRYNDETTIKNFKQIDGIFGLQGGGCDVCAINLKRFWCQYACSARQDTFLDVGKDYEPFPDPQKPGNIIYGLRMNARVHTQTACVIYNSCKRNAFVASVSAMGSPAGFLNFQGHNAINDGHFYLSLNFSYNLNDSLSFSSSLQDYAYDDLMTCDYKTSQPEVHNFTFGANCSCSTCEQACDPNDGFQYKQADVLQGFNYVLVGGAYAFVLAITGGLSIYRHCTKKRKDD